MRTLLISLMMMIILLLSIIYTQGKKQEIINNRVYDGKPADVIALAPSNIRVFFRIKQYAKEFDIPPYIAFRVARSETGFRNPFDFSYNHAQTSTANAYGVIQVQLPTAKWHLSNNNVTEQQLLYNIKFNVRTGLSYLKRLYNRYGDWKIALGFYNSGYPKINDYALNIYYTNI